MEQKPNHSQEKLKDCIAAILLIAFFYIMIVAAVKANDKEYEFRMQRLDAHFVAIEAEAQEGAE